VATFMWAFAGHQDPTPGDIGVMVVLIVLPLIALLPIAGLVQRRRLKPVLAAAPLTPERIPFAELQKKVRAATPLKQSLNALVASLFAFFSASFAVLTHFLTRHFPFDSYVALWGFVAIAFGFASFGIAKFLARRPCSKALGKRTDDVGRPRCARTPAAGPRRAAMASLESTSLWPIRSLPRSWAGLGLRCLKSLVADLVGVVDPRRLQPAREAYWLEAAPLFESLRQIEVRPLSPLR